MKKAALTANRAVTLDGLDLSLCFNLESHPPAMASAAMFNQVTLKLVYAARPAPYRNKLFAA
jgi:hypothetical protein